MFVYQYNYVSVDDLVVIILQNEKSLLEEKLKAVMDDNSSVKVHVPVWSTYCACSDVPML